MNLCNLCLCGCGQEVTKEGNKYILGHHWRNKKRPDISGENHQFYHKKRQEHSKYMKSEKHPTRGKKRPDNIERCKGVKRPDFSGVKHPLFGKHHSEETRKKMSEIRIKYFDKIGRNQQEYCPLFSYKWWRKIFYKRDQNTCQLCGCTRQLNFKLTGQKVLSIHHINHIKKDCEPDNCVLLCCSCNIRAENKKTKTEIETFLKSRTK